MGNTHISKQIKQMDILLVGVAVKSGVVFLIVFKSNFHKKDSFVDNLQNVVSLLYLEQNVLNVTEFD